MARLWGAGLAALAATTLSGCFGLDVRVCGEHEWVVEQRAGEPMTAERVIDVSFEDVQEFKDYRKHFSEFELRRATLEVVDVLDGNEATTASGVMSLANADGSDPVEVGVYRDVPLSKGTEVKLELSEAGRERVSQALSRQPAAFQARVAGQVDQVPAHARLKARFELIARVGAGGIDIDVDCVKLPGRTGAVSVAQ